MNPKLEKQLAELPNHPGIYKYYDHANKLLYIGKAASLKKRVSSYFQKTRHDPKTTELVYRIARLATVETDSVIEALILEANLIKLYQPPYNLAQKDDKTFVQIGITNEPFPRILSVRPTEPMSVGYRYQFGPYPSAESVRIALAIIRKIFPFRTKCKVGEKPGRGCLDYQIGLCPGACAGAISDKEYKIIVRKIVLFLSSKKTVLIRELERDMKQAAKEEQFEEAAKLRNQLFALKHIRDVALIRREQSSAQEQTGSFGFGRIEGYDISNIAADHAVGSMVVVTNGKAHRSEYRKFLIRTVVGQNDVRMMEEVVTRRLRHVEWPYPDLFVIDGGKGHLAIIKRVLKRFQVNIPIIAVAKGPERKKLDLHPSLPGLLVRITPEIQAALRLARDEAHRFAITYHRTRRDKQFLVE